MKLLVAVSHENYDAGALEVVSQLGADADVTLLHAGDPASPPPAVTQVAERLRAVGARVTLVLAHGDPAHAIVERARQESADLVVVRGHDRHPGLLRRVFGDTVEKVVERCDRPVLALRGRASPHGRDIVLAAGRPSPRMLDVTAQVAKATSSRITIVHVTGDAPSDPLFAGHYRSTGQTTVQRGPVGERAIERNSEALRSRGAEVEVKEREGLVERELAAEANSGAHWLMVVRARPVGFLHRLVLGHSFTEDLVRHVETSVLILR